MEPNRVVSEWIFRCPHIDPVTKGTIVPLVRGKEEVIARLKMKNEALKRIEESEKICIVFDGPPGHKSGRFVEVENEHGEGLSISAWKRRGEYWYLEIPNPARLQAENDCLEDELDNVRSAYEKLQAENETLQSYKKEVEAVADLMFQFCLRRLQVGN